MLWHLGLLQRHLDPLLQSRGCAWGEAKEVRHRPGLRQWLHLGRGLRLHDGRPLEFQSIRNDSMVYIVYMIYIY